MTLNEVNQSLVIPTKTQNIYLKPVYIKKKQKDPLISTQVFLIYECVTRFLTYKCT